MALTGMDNHMATFWLREGLIQGDGERTDPKKRLRFPFYEANVVAILLHLRDGGVGVEALKAISGLYRNALSWASTLALDPDDVRSIWKYKSKPNNDEELAWSYFGLRQASNFGVFQSYDADERLVDIADRMDLNSFVKNRELYLQITSQPTEVRDRVYPTFFWRGPDGWKARVSGDDAPTGPRADGVFTTIAVDVDAITYRVWNPGSAIPAHPYLGGQR